MLSFQPLPNFAEGEIEVQNGNSLMEEHTVDLAAVTSQHSFYYILQSPEKFANLKKYSQPKR